MTQQHKRPCDWDESAWVRMMKYLGLPVKLPEPERKKS